MAPERGRQKDVIKPPIEQDVGDIPEPKKKPSLKEFPKPTDFLKQVQEGKSLKKTIQSQPAPIAQNRAYNPELLNRAIAMNTDTNDETDEGSSEWSDTDIANAEVLPPEKGSGIKMSKDGLYDYQIEEILEDKTKQFVPVITSDEILTLSKYIKKPKGRFCFVMNTDNSHGPGKHWVSLCIDWDNCEIDYYDSLADDPTKRTLDDVHKLIMKFRPEVYMKLKVNRTKDQSDKSSNCGWFASNFVISMLRGAKFGDASLYTNVKQGEAKIERFKKSFL